MKSFLYITLLLSLLLLSITPEEVSGKTLKCYLYTGLHNDYVKECVGDDVVCISAVKEDNEAVVKTCGERNEAKSECEEMAKFSKGTCKKPCDTDLCNNELISYGDEGYY